MTQAAFLNRIKTHLDAITGGGTNWEFLDVENMIAVVFVKGTAQRYAISYADVFFCACSDGDIDRGNWIAALLNGKKRDESGVMK